MSRAKIQTMAPAIINPVPKLFLPFKIADNAATRWTRTKVSAKKTVMMLKMG